MCKNETDGFKTWAIVEQNGHRTFCGVVSEVVIAGTPFVRIDIPRGEKEWHVKYLGAATIFALTPCDEATGRKYAQQVGLTFVDSEIVRTRFPALAAPDDDDLEEYPDEDDDEDDL